MNVIVVLSISGCKDYQPAVEEQEQTKTEIKIGVAVYDAEDTFVQTVYDVMQEYAKREEGAGVAQLTFKIAAAENNQEIQNKQIDTFINEQYSAIAVNIVDRSQASTIINKAQRANIPLVFFNREPVPQDMAIWDKVYYVGAKAEQSGKMQAEILINAVEAGVDVDANKDGLIQYVMLEGEPGHQDAILRSYYSIGVLEESGYKLENLASDTGMWRKDIAKEKMSRWLDEFGKQIEVVIAGNDEMALGAIEIIEEKGCFDGEHTIRVIGVDGLEPAVTAIKEDKMLGTVFNNADKQAEAILAQIYTLVTDTEPKIIKNAEYEEKCFHTPYEIIDKNTLNE